MNRNELFEYMQSIVDKTVMAYKSDFDIDRESIAEWGNDTYWGVWVVRESGTQLKRFTDNVLPMYHIDAVCENMRVEEMYVIDHRAGNYEITPTDREEVRQKYKTLDEYDLEVFATETYQYPMCDTTGCFTTEKKATEYGETLMKNMNGKSFRVTYRGRH